MGRENIYPYAHIEQHQRQVSHVDAAAHATAILLKLVLAVTVLAGILLLLHIHLDVIDICVPVIV